RDGNCAYYRPAVYRPAVYRPAVYRPAVEASASETVLDSAVAIGTDAAAADSCRSLIWANSHVRGAAQERSEEKAWRNHSGPRRRAEPAVQFDRSVAVSGEGPRPGLRGVHRLVGARVPAQRAF